MSARRSLVHPLLEALGVEHGFGVRDGLRPPDVMLPEQVHGKVVAEPGLGGVLEPARADAVVSRGPGQRIGILTARSIRASRTTRAESKYEAAPIRSPRRSRSPAFAR